MPDRNPTQLIAPPADLLEDASLFLDFDGTLVEIADRPDAVSVSPRLAALMHALDRRLDGRLALVSGRPADEIATLFGADLCTVVGSHGMEFRRPDGKREQAERPAGLADALAAMSALAADAPGVIVENKPLGAALHFRAAPDREGVCVALAERLARDHGLHLQHGKMMVEVRASGGDKGSAIRALTAEPRFADTRPVFIGDDLTDEPGFAAVAALGGAGILVGPERPTDARFRLEDVDAVLGWLGTIAGVEA
ncbi:trehalose-phosphatase [Sphingomonas sp. RS6]